MARCEEKTKRIYVFENGQISNGKLVSINGNQFPTWNKLLGYVTEVIEPLFGAIRTLKTADGKKTITCFSDLEDNQKYVACGKLPFMKIKEGYLLKDEVKVKRKCVQHYKKQDDVDFTALIESKKNNRIIIFVFTNGSDNPPVKFVLQKKDLLNYQELLDHIGNALDMPGGVYKLYTIFGHVVCGPFEFQHGGCYVATSYGEKFIEQQYVDRYDEHYSDSIKVNDENCYKPTYKFQIAAMGSTTNIKKKTDFCLHKISTDGNGTVRIQRDKRPHAKPMSYTYKGDHPLGTEPETSRKTPPVKKKPKASISDGGTKVLQEVEDTSEDFGTDEEEEDIDDGHGDSNEQEVFDMEASVNEDEKEVPPESNRRFSTWSEPQVDDNERLTDSSVSEPQDEKTESSARSSTKSESQVDKFEWLTESSARSSIKSEPRVGEKELLPESTERSSTKSELRIPLIFSGAETITISKSSTEDTYDTYDVSGISKSEDDGSALRESTNKRPLRKCSALKKDIILDDDEESSRSAGISVQQLGSFSQEDKDTTEDELFFINMWKQQRNNIPEQDPQDDI